MRLSALTALVALAAASELSPVDDARARFYTLETELWANFTNPELVFEGEDYDPTPDIAAWADNVEAVSMFQSHFSTDMWIWTQILEQVEKINMFYKDFFGFLRSDRSPLLVSNKEDLVDYRPQVSVAVTKLHELLASGNKILYDSAHEVGNTNCIAAVSYQKLCYDIYKTVALAELKGYAVLQLTRILLTIYRKGNYAQELLDSREKYSNRATKMATEARTAINSNSRKVYLCDPPEHIEGTTYEQVTRLLQGYVENEVDMSASGSCGSKCADYARAEHRGCFKDQFCAHQSPCFGRIFDCGFVESHMAICLASRNSARRYEWIEYSSGRKLGEVKKCASSVTQVNSWWRWLFWHCSYCMCLCDDPTHSDRYFSLREATSDVHNNKVVTGVRFVKHGGVFHLQVHEGTLKQGGGVEPVDWVPIKTFDPYDYGVHQGVEYHKLSYEERAIDLTTQDSPTGHVLTGIKFVMRDQHLHLEIRSTPFNYTTGQLTPEKSRWISRPSPSTRLRLVKPDIPTRGYMKSHVDSSHDQYVEFTHSDYDADAAQSTVPFVDVQPVLPSKGSALMSGAGVLHRGARGSGGLLALQLLSYPHAAHVWAPTPTHTFDDYSDTTTEPEYIVDTIQSSLTR